MTSGISVNGIEADNLFSGKVPLGQILLRISSSLPQTWWRTTPRQLSPSGSCSTLGSWQPQVPTSVSVFTSGFVRILFLLKLYSVWPEGIKRQNLLLEQKLFPLICLNMITLYATFVTDMTCRIIMGSKVYPNYKVTLYRLCSKLNWRFCNGSTYPKYAGSLRNTSSLK